ncbi:sulfotransferase [Stenotrophomonas sp. HITSZ_GD]|uniref:tetratricopeptide repeat-containing sulfotransferase family protein n=1 Tax=Stenotrophomonas sp. HITSZ_GD TaxID=3037248 RepID=UPI00240D6E2F|nr:sulfotransferase [Stenotrophomonas sp. HITSZ_GD]MDG2524457.1 sulfotransferase [Stenotrophomonas sp. HITSZ_GD]
MNTTAGTQIAALVAQAEQFAAHGDFARAIGCHQRALALSPGRVDSLLQLSYLYSLAGHYRGAEAWMQHAQASPQATPQQLAAMIPRLRTFNDIPALRRVLARLGPPARMQVPALITAASHLTYANLPEEAIAYLDEAKRADPDYPATLLARAQVLMYLGRFDEAEQDIVRSQRRAPEIAQGYWLRAALGRQSAERNGAAAIRRELQRPGRTANDMALLEFALHKTLDDLGEYDDAWQALTRGCAHKRATLDYDDARNQRLFDALTALPPLPQAEASADGARPLFIVGMHRSGTTLLEQMLCGSTEVKGIGELYDFTSAMRHATDHHCRGVVDEEIVRRAAAIDPLATGARYLHSTSWRLDGERCFTDKLPSNFLNIGFIAATLPHARILHMVRDPVETCFSNLRELFSEANPYSYDMHELARYYQRYRRLMAHWHARFPGRILDVSYARLVREPEAVMHEVAAFCGIAYSPGMLNSESRQRGVVTASAVQVRARPSASERPKWAPYAAGLAPMIEALSQHD